MKKHSIVNRSGGNTKYVFNATLTDREYYPQLCGNFFLLSCDFIVFAAWLVTVLISAAPLNRAASLLVFPSFMFSVALILVRSRLSAWGQDAIIELSQDGLNVQLYIPEADGISATTEHYFFPWDQISVSLSRSGCLHVVGAPAITINDVPVIMEWDSEAENWSDYACRSCFLTFRVREPKAEIFMIRRIIKNELHSRKLKG